MQIPTNVADCARKLLSLAEVVHRWAGALAMLDRARRLKVAGYADEIAATLARAAKAASVLERNPSDLRATRDLIREFGRIAGYLETMVAVLQHHLDGRKLAGVKRRLEQLGPHPVMRWVSGRHGRARVDRLVAAEGYFRALADGLRT